MEGAAAAADGEAQKKSVVTFDTAAACWLERNLRVDEKPVALDEIRREDFMVRGHYCFTKPTICFSLRPELNARARREAGLQKNMHFTAAESPELLGRVDGMS